MLFGDTVYNFNLKIMGHHIFGGDRMHSDELSPVSALRLNFDQLTSKTTDEDVETKNIFGMSLPQFVPQRIISWIGNGAGGTESDAEVGSNASGSSVKNNNEQSPCVSRKVCPFVCIFARRIDKLDLSLDFIKMWGKKINIF